MALVATSSVQQAYTAAAAAAGGSGLQVDDLSVLLASTKEFFIDVIPEATTVTTGTRKVSFRLPYAFVITGATFSQSVTPTGTGTTIDVKNATVSVYTTLPIIGVGSLTSTSGAAPGVLTNLTTGVPVAANAEITVDVTTAGTVGTGLKMFLSGRRVA